MKGRETDKTIDGQAERQTDVLIERLRDALTDIQTDTYSDN